MRAFASYLAGLLLLGSLVAAGGAAIRPRPELMPIRLTAADASLFAAPKPVEPLFPKPSPAPEIGCRVPMRGAVCAPGELRAIPPPGPYDLVPPVVRSVEDWRPLVASFFEPKDVDRALRVIRCESGGNPLARNPRSSARGLFQHLGSLWPARAAKAGWAGASIDDPVANVAVAAWLVYHGGGWSHWNASSHCW